MLSLKFSSYDLMPTNSWPHRHPAGSTFYNWLTMTSHYQFFEESQRKTDRTSTLPISLLFVFVFISQGKHIPSLSDSPTTNLSACWLKQTFWKWWQLDWSASTSNHIINGLAYGGSLCGASSSSSVNAALWNKVLAMFLSFGPGQ